MTIFPNYLVVPLKNAPVAEILQIEENHPQVFFTLSSTRPPLELGRAHEDCHNLHSRRGGRSPSDDGTQYALSSI